MKSFWKKIYLWLAVIALALSGSVYSGGGGETAQEKADREQREREQKQEKSKKAGKFEDLAPLTYTDDKQEPISPKAHGRLTGKFSISKKSGSAEYNIPITVAKGFKGLSPGLSLHYQSDGQNGVYGVGWSLGGIPSLSRCGTNATVDGVETYNREAKTKVVEKGRKYYIKNKKGLKFDFKAGVNKGMELRPYDQLCFNGVRLKLKSGDHGKKGAEYRSIHDRWVKAKITSANYGKWMVNCLSANHEYCIIKVYDSTGKVTAFSNYSHHDKRTFFPEYTEDKKGNRLEYQWTNEYDKETLLASVNYVSNPKTGREASRRVHFYYDDRPDKKKSYSGGYEFKSYKRLKTIEAHHRSGTSDWLVTNRWHLKYKKSKTTRRSLLTSVQLCDGMTNGKCLPATEFDYSEGVNPLKAFSQNDKEYHLDKASPEIKFESLSSKVVGDVNGDGLADLVWVERDKGSRSECGPFEKNKANDGVDMACSSLNQFSNGQRKFGPKKCVCMKNDSEAPSSLILPGDHNNDGKMDLIYFSAVSKHFTNHRVMVVRGGVNGFEEPSFIENEERSESVHLNNKTSWGMLGDFVYRGDVHSKQSVKDLGKEQWGTNYPRMLGDFNGDGIKDMLGFAHNNVVVHLGELKGNNKDKARLGYGSNWLSQMTKGKGGWNSDKHPRMTGDVTGDGLADIIGFASKNVSVAVNTGQDFLDGRNWHSGMGSSDGWKLHRHKRIMSDVNGDGLMDIIAFGEQKTMVYVSTGSSFKWFWDSKDFAAKEWDEGNEPRFAQDLNGDGMADLIGFSNDGHIVVRYATGTGFGPLHSVSSSGIMTGKNNWTGENNPRMFADVNGDGLPDLIGYANNWANVVINQNADAERGIPADKIVKVTDGYGEPLDIEYATIIHGEKGLRKATGQLGGKDVPHYQSTKTYKYPQSGNVGSEPIVKKTTLSNSAGTDVETEYFYQNMSNNVNGLGSEGFEIFVSKNVETGAHVEEKFLQPFPKSRKPKWRYVRDADGNVSASEQYTHTNASQDNDYSSGSNDSWITDNLHEIRQAEHISYNGWEGSIAETNRTKSYYGKSGLNYKIEVIPTEIGGDKGYVKCNQFLVDEDRWLIYLPTEERTNKAGEGCYFGNELGDSISAKRLTYNSYGEVTSEEVLLPNSQKNTTQYSWDRDGGLLKMIEPNGARTTYELDNGKYGHMFNTKTCNEYNHCELRTYHHTGQVATKISTTGTISKVVVDSFGRTTEMWGAHRDPNVPMEDESDLYKLRAIAYKKPLNKKDGVLLVKNWIRSSWDTLKVNAVRGGKGSNLFEFEYIDVVGNKIKTEKSGRKIGETKTWTVKYNSAGQVIEKFDPHSIDGKADVNQVKFEFYPGSPRIKRSWNPRTNVDVTYTYDDYGLTTIESYPSPSSDGGGRRTVTKEKTVNGKLLRKYTDGDESTAMVYEYDHANALIKKTDPKGGVTTITRNQVGQVTKTCKPDAGCTEAEYWKNSGKVKLTRDANGDETRMWYDKLGRVTKVTNNLGTTENKYDQGGGLKTGKLTKVLYPDGAIRTYDYNRDGDVTTNVFVLPENKAIAGVRVFTSTVEADGTQVLPTGDKISYGFTRGQQDSVYLNGNLVYKVKTFDHTGKAGHVEFGNGLQKFNEFDSLGRLKRHRTYSKDWRVVHGEAITYHESNSKITKVERLDMTDVREFTYDQQGRMSSSVYRGKNQNYGYDKNSNMISMGNDTYILDTVGNRTWGAKVGGKDIFYRYDNAGNVISKRKGGKTTTFEYTNGTLTKIKGPNGDTILDGRTRIDPDGTKTTMVEGIKFVERNGKLTHSFDVTAFGKRIMAVTRNGAPNLAANSIRHNSFKLQAGMFDPTTLTGAYGFLKNKIGELLTRDNIVNELLIGTSFVFSIGLMLAMLINIFRRRAQGKVKWWHYPMIVLFFTVTTTLPVSAITLDPGSNGKAQLEVGETYFHKGYIGGTQATSDGTGKMKGRVSYDIFGKLAYKQDGAKDNFAAKGFGKELAQDQDGIVFHGKRLFDQDINRFMNVDPEAQYPSSYRYATDPASNYDPTGGFVFTIGLIIGLVVAGLATGFAMAASISGTAKFWEWDAATWGFFVLGCVIGAALAVATGGAGNAAVASWAAASGTTSAALAGTWTAFAITSAVGFAIGVGGAMVTGAIVQGGQIATGRRTSFDWAEWGNYVLNNGVIGGAISIGAGGLFKLGGQGFQALANNTAASTSKWGKGVNWIATKFAGGGADGLVDAIDAPATGSWGGHMKSVASNISKQAWENMDTTILTGAVKFGGSAMVWAGFKDCESGAACVALSTAGAVLGSMKVGTTSWKYEGSAQYKLTTGTGNLTADTLALVGEKLTIMETTEFESWNKTGSTYCNDHAADGVCQ